jgi:hypothetical protein
VRRGSGYSPRKARTGARFVTCLVLILPAAAGPGEPAFHLTAHSWQPLRIAPSRYLDVIEGLCRFTARHQNSEGVVIDPFLHREHQYATPYFAYAIGTLISAGRARDLLPNGIQAMEHATRLFAGGRDAIPEQHGEFFIPSLTAALELYEPIAPKDRWLVWRERMKKPLSLVIKGSVNNWQTYAMKGEWLRAQAGLAPREGAIAIIEENWRARQQDHFAVAPWFLYHDRSSDPDTLSVEAVGRGNLLALVEQGYDGPSAAAIRRLAEAGTLSTLWLQDPSGQVPANGRTDNHVWVDVGYQLAFEVMAERSVREQNPKVAGQYRHAALLAFQNIDRWRRTDPPWDGSYFITKNHFDPALRVGYQTASEYSNYTGSLMFHLSEAYRTRRTEIDEQPTLAEIGGYAFALDTAFATALANAGGLQMQLNLRGDTGESSGNYWTPMGVVRFARVGWDTRLGPADGALTKEGGVTFAPAFNEQGRWVRMAGLSSRYEAKFSGGFTHPALVRCSIVYQPRPGQSGPSFRNDFTLTPDGILSELTKISTDDVSWGVTWPLIENDGRPLVVARSAAIASTGYQGAGDRQNFIALNPQSTLDYSEAPLRSTYGDLRPVLVTVRDQTNRSFIYPANAAQPPAEVIRRSFRRTAGGFNSVLGRVEGDMYVGRTVAGGQGRAVDLDGDGKPDVVFSDTCRFLIQLSKGKVIALEADRRVAAAIAAHRVDLQPYEPVFITSAGTPSTPASPRKTVSTRTHAP